MTKYRILKGTLTVDGKSPDGDTIAFKLDEEQVTAPADCGPTDPDNSWIWPKKDGGRYPRFNKKFHANVRFEAIDALELHFSPQMVYPVKNTHQNMALAKAARDRMLSLCGFDGKCIEENDQCKLSDSKHQEIEAVVAYNGVDTYGRLIGFVFTPEDAPELSTYKVPERILDAKTILRSVNAQLLREGLVFPTYYGGLHPSIRNALTESFQEARENGRGVWENYQGELTLPRKPDLEEIQSANLMPKVFRRLVTHLSRNGALSNLYSFLEEGGDKVVDTVDVRLSGFEHFLVVDEVKRGKTYKLRLTRRPEELVFLPK